MTYTDTAGDPLGGKFKSELELIRARLEPTPAAQGYLVFEQGSEAIPKVCGTPFAGPATQQSSIPRYALARSSGAIVDLDETMQTDDEVTDPKWFGDR